MLKYFTVEFFVIELEGLTLSIASLFHVIPEGDAKPLFVKLCANIATGATEDNVKHRMKL